MHTYKCTPKTSGHSDSKMKTHDKKKSLNNTTNVIKETKLEKHLTLKIPNYLEYPLQLKRSLNTTAYKTNLAA